MPVDPEPLNRAKAVSLHRNLTFSWQEFVANPANPQAAVLATCGHDDMSVSDADIADLTSARDHLDEPLRSLFDRLIVMARVRQRNLLTFTGVEVLSLGCDCFSRTLPTRWGLKATARLGERSAPFDLSVTTPDGVERLMLEGFDHLTDPALLTFSDEHQIPLNLSMGTTFNHEVGADYAVDDFARLRSTYEPRVAHINHVIAGETPLLMIVHIPDFFGAHPSHIDLFRRVFDSVLARRSAPTAMVVINTFAPSAPSGMGGGSETGSDGSAEGDIRAGPFQWWNTPLPFDGYVWHSVDHFMSAQGLAFEHDVATRLHHLATVELTVPNHSRGN